MSEIDVSTGAVLFVPGRLFTLAELHAMKIDGVLWPIIGDAFRPVTVAETVPLRAAALAYQIPAALLHRAALSQLSAAWVYGCAPPPKVVSLVQDHTGKSASLPPFSGCTLREVTLERFDLQSLGDTLVTSPLRTAVDIARTAPLGVARAALLRLSQAATLNCPLGRIQQALGTARNIPGKIRGQALLEEMLKGPAAQ